VQVKSQMIVFGGWSSTESFNDMWSLDTDTRAWSQVETGRFGSARWNHAAVSVATVPYWQVFVFGGGLACGRRGHACGEQGNADCETEKIGIVHGGSLHASTLWNRSGSRLNFGSSRGNEAGFLDLSQPRYLGCYRGLDG
jgi:hypothetical protein